MKKIIGLITFLTLFTVSNVSFSQTDLSACTDYPTTDQTLNGLVKNLVGNISQLDSKFSSIYFRLTPEEQHLAIIYMKNNDRNLFQRFPQFEDIELKNGVAAIRAAYTAVLARFRELYPNSSYDEQVQKTNSIIKCCAVKIASEQFESGTNRIDPCSSARKNCLVSVVAQTTLMHIGCAAADLTIIVGILCHSAVFAYQVSESNICESDYKNCKG